jgi:hypothetical protein
METTVHSVFATGVEQPHLFKGTLWIFDEIAVLMMLRGRKEIA